MKNLIKHLLKNDLESLINRSVVNYRVKGLHKIELVPNVITLFVTTPDHELGSKTTFVELTENVKTIEAVKNGLMSIQYSKLDYGNAYSLIKSSNTGFEIIGGDKLKVKSVSILNSKDTFVVDPNTYHSIEAGKNSIASWLMYGKLNSEEVFYKQTADKNFTSYKPSKEGLEKLIDLSAINLHGAASM